MARKARLLSAWSCDCPNRELSAKRGRKGIHDQLDIGLNHPGMERKRELAAGKVFGSR
jgi:hypothetical protein